jgi:phosphatidylserine/phosphatidylglycerophosphate/cardiolipin synthase-like enzyme
MSSVRVMYDSVDSLATPAEYFERLRAAGVAVCEFNPLNPLRMSRWSRLTVNNRDQREILIVDGQAAFTGGINISAAYSSGSFGRTRKPPDPTLGGRDIHVLARGPVVTQFQQLFDDAWRSQGCEPAAEAGAPRKVAAPAHAGNALLHAKTAVIDSGWFSVGSTNLDWRSFVHSYEADLLVLDSRFAGELESLFRLDQATSHEVVQSEWRERDLGARFLEWLVWRWEYLL